MSKLKRPVVGDRRWRVEWVYELGMFEGEHEPDLNKSHFAVATTKEEATSIAKEKFPLDQYGAVSYWEEEFVAYDDDDAIPYPHVGYWDAVSEVFHYEGEE